MKLYTHPISGNARKVEFVLRHAGVDAELIRVDLGKGEQRDPEFVELNPNGKVPVLVDGDFALWESHAIMRYLAREYAPEMLGSDPQARAEVDQWLCWQLAHLGPTMGTLIYERTLKPMRGAESDEVAIERATVELDRLAPILEARLDGRDFVAGDTLTLADVSLAVSVASAPVAGTSFEAYPAITSWFERVRALPAWQDLPSLKASN